MLITDLKLALSVYETIIRLLEKESIIERIGLCFGLVSENGRVRIEEFTEIENLDASPSSFSLDYIVMIKQITYYKKKGKNFVGLFHSHPSGHSLLPSKKDRHYMQYWPSPFVWLIGAFPQIIAFGFSQNKVCQIPYTLFDTK
ncbi:MAG: Mov34/MPN/PAD-1 family protein [Candidatus Heimdallarchaeota archaeon]|nr:Mov34/MPN/PAD-1 family protein [Candidatus Heimdallarchaeota archaeon]